MKLFKLSTDKEVDLHELTQIQRQECENTIIREVSLDGRVAIRNGTLARNLWCQYGMKTDLDGLADFTSAELDEIMLEVGRKAGVYADPTEPGD